MTGVALFFLAAAWMLKPRIHSIGIMVLLASFFKLFDALLLGFPIRHGAIGNPIFAIMMEGAAFLLVVSLIKETLAAKSVGRGLIGGISALAAVNLFPLVRFATGVPACVMPGTAYPLSLYYAPLAVALSFLTVPFGFWLGGRIASLENSRAAGEPAALFRWISPAALALSLAVLALLRLT
jgi:hypothetical protein